MTDDGGIVFIVRFRVGGVEDLAMGYGSGSWLLLDSLLFQCHLVYGKRSLNLLEAAQVRFAKLLLILTLENTFCYGQ